MWKWCLSIGLAWALIPTAGSRAAPPPGEMVRHDWYQREALTAIRDWEAILAWWEQRTPQAERMPVFPVPTSGAAVSWVNPMPRPLLPAEEAPVRLQLRLAGGKVELERALPAGKRERQTSAPGKPIVGCSHPGSGGRNQWYHRYQRRFDRLLTFVARPAPFALDLPTPLELLPGRQELRLSLRNVTDRPLTIAARLRCYRRGAQGIEAAPPLDGPEATLAGGAARTVALRVDLTATGGGLLLLELQAAGQSYRMPLFTYVEDLQPLLTGIERHLADHAPQPAAAARLAELRRRAGTGEPLAGTAWRALFAQASTLRDELLLGRIDFDTLVFLKRKPFFSEQPFMDSHHLFNRPGGGIYRLSPVRPGGTVTAVADRLGEGVYRDVCLHWDAGKLLFAFGNGSDRWDGKQSYHLYEIGVNGKGLRQLTFGPKNDCEPFYLPGGKIGFTSDRSEHFVMCGDDRHVANLHTMNADGSGIRQLSHNVFNEFNPSLLADGRILYTRWEYNERSVTSVHSLFTIRPDGSHPEPFYGNASIRPNVHMFGRQVPGSDKVTALLTAHHGQTHGPIGLIDPRRGRDGPGPLTVLTPGIPISAHAVEDSFHGWFSDPLPLTDKVYLCAFTPTVRPWLEKSWALYVGDRHGNLALVHRDPDISCAEPRPLRRRPAPPELAPAAPDRSPQDATLLIVDVTRGLAGVSRQEVKWLRILEDQPRRSVPHGGVIVTSGTSIYTTKRILGTVPIEPDGSVHFQVPPDRNLYFQVLDGQHREIQRMRSVVCLKPGEKRTCIGCHAGTHRSPPSVLMRAAQRPPSRPEPPPWGTRSFSFRRDIQPILDAKCAACHTQDRKTNRVILTADLTDQFAVGYQELLPYLSVASAMRWDNPEDVYARPPYSYGSKVSRLTQLLERGHHGVKLSREEWLRLVTWIDTNAVYYDRYESCYPRRSIFSGAVRQVANDVFRRRCASCHAGKELDEGGKYGTWWLSLNDADAARSRALQAPLARAAGGWERCRGPVFASTADADYQRLLAALTRLREQLRSQPREDLLSREARDDR